MLHALFLRVPWLPTQACRVLTVSWDRSDLWNAMIDSSFSPTINEVWIPVKYTIIYHESCPLSRIFLIRLVCWHFWLLWKLVLESIPVATALLPGYNVLFIKTISFDFQREARRHFNCPTLKGMELENLGGRFTRFYHWKKRLLEVSFQKSNCRMSCREQVIRNLQSMSLGMTSNVVVIAICMISWTLTRPCTLNY